MFWRKKKPAPKMTMRNKLTVHFTDESRLSWGVDNHKGPLLTPWKRFYKWFFGRTGDVFIMRYNGGEQMFRRDQIKRFDISCREVEIDA